MTLLDETTLPKPILAQVRAILARDADADRMALVWPDPITPAERVQQVDGVALRFVWCASELALRERLVANRGAPGAAPKADPEADPGADPEADPEVVLEAAAGETGQAAGDPRLVLLTPLDERRLSRDLLARLWGHAPKRISPWRTLEQLLRLREIDPRLTTKDYRWISACLLEQYDRYRDRVQFGEVLDFDLAWRALATALLDLDGEGLDLDMLLDWSQRPDSTARVAALPEPMAQHLEDWLRPRLGEQVQVVLALWRNGQAGGMLAIGLVCSLLYGRERQPSDRQPSDRQPSDRQSSDRQSSDRQPGRSALATLLQARGRFSERLLGGAAIPEPLLARFGAAAVSHLERALAANPALEIGPIVDAAEQLLASLELTQLAVESDLLPKGYALRLTAFTQALEQVLDQVLDQVSEPIQPQSPERPPERSSKQSSSPSAQQPKNRAPGRRRAQVGLTQSILAAQETLAQLERHRLAGRQDAGRAQQLQTARMALRACQWLATSPASDAPPAAAIQDYLAHGGWLDWARSKLWRGDAHEPLSRVYKRLSARLAERREAFNQGFARHLPAIARGDRIADWVVPIEDGLAQRVAPLADARPVLLVVLDGMSQAVYRELAEDLLRHHWVELQPLEPAAETCLLAALPTITRLSRYALLSGSLGEGVSSDEKRAFASHAALRRVSSAKAPPQLFHKAELTEPRSGSLSERLRAAIASEQPRVIGAVVNAVDDQLSSNAQLGVPWSLAALAVLRQMLEAARESGRLVVLTSDHGHVLDHDMQRRQAATDAERFRSAAELSAGAEPEPGEVLVEGRRVATPEQRVVLPWSEQLRYGAQKMGYHGGGAPQEVLVPFGVFRSAGDSAPVAGWQEVPRREPDWWLLDGETAMTSKTRSSSAAPAGVEAAPSPAQSPARSSARDAAKAAGQLALDLAAETAATGGHRDAGPDWIDALLASPVYQQIKGRGGRVPISDAQLRRLLSLLAQGDGQQMMEPLAKGLGIPSIRLPGLLAGASRRLNLDGYPLLSVDRAAKTVRLDIRSLRVQFELD